MAAPAPPEAGTTAIAFVDLAAQHAELRPEIDAVVARVIDDSSFIGGPRVESFERAFAEYVGAPHAVGVGSGTDAVRIALQLAGVGPGDAVLTVSHTFIGTVEGALQLGAVPLFLDIDPRSKTLSPESLERVLASDCDREGDALRHRPTARRIGAILPVHLYGQSAEMPPILELAERYGVPVVEDAAQAHGASCRFSEGHTAPCGAMGRTAAFSFYPGKNLGAMGEAGAVTMREEALDRKARMLRDHGQSRKYIHELPDGGNARLDTLQAAVLELKLGRLEAWNTRRRDVARLYRRLLAGCVEPDRLELPEEMPWADHVYHLFVVQSPQRDALKAALDARGVPTGFHYPVPLHRQPAFEGQGLELEPLPHTARAAATCLSLPMHPHLTDEQVERVVEAVVESIETIEG